MIERYNVKWANNDIKGMLVPYYTLIETERSEGIRETVKIDNVNNCRKI